jgi:two-component system, NarL family, response regulator DegU
MVPEGTCISVMIVEDHTIVREGLRSLLAYPWLEIVGDAVDGKEAIEKADQLLPDVILMDIRLPHISGLEATRQIKSRHPSTAVIMLTMYENEEYVVEAIKAGASGYVLKDISPTKLGQAIQIVYEGGSIVEPQLLSRVLGGLALTDQTETPSLPSMTMIEALTAREHEVLGLLVQGRTNPEIAQELFISRETVKGHVSEIIHKLGASDRTQAAVIAMRRGLID